MQGKELIALLITIWSLTSHAQLWGPRPKADTQIPATTITPVQSYDTRMSGTTDSPHYDKISNDNVTDPSTISYQDTATKGSTSSKQDPDQQSGSISSKNSFAASVTSTPSVPAIAALEIESSTIPTETDKPTTMTNGITTIKMHNVKEEGSSLTNTVVANTVPSTIIQEKSTVKHNSKHPSQALDNTVTPTSTSTMSTAYEMSSPSPTSIDSKTMPTSSLPSSPSSAVKTKGVSSRTTDIVVSNMTTSVSPALENGTAILPVSAAVNGSLTTESTTTNTYPVSVTMNSSLSQENKTTDNTSDPGTTSRKTSTLPTKETSVQPSALTSTKSTLKNNIIATTVVIENTTNIDTNVTVDPERLHLLFTDEDTSDSFWPVVVALTIAVPTVVVFGVTITVLYRRRMAKPRRPFSDDYTHM